MQYFKDTILAISVFDNNKYNKVSYLLFITIYWLIY